MASLSLDTVLITFTWEDFAASFRKINFSLFFITRHIGNGAVQYIVWKAACSAVRIRRAAILWPSDSSPVALQWTKTDNYVKMCGFGELPRKRSLKWPTHNRGHTLHLLISRGLNVSSIVIKDVALSDHFCIFFDILISVTTESRSVSVRKRCINKNTSALFMKAISLTPSISADSFDLLLDSFNSKVKNVIDNIAAVKVSKKTGRQKSSRRKSTAVQSMKRQCRKAERMWRKTKLKIHYSIYKDSLHAFNVELATAWQTFFSNLINSNLNNTRTLFATVERLTNPPSQIPSEMLSDSKCNEFAFFFFWEDQ